MSDLDSYKFVTKKKTKKTITMTIDDDLNKEFSKICKSKKYKKSQIINNFLEIFIEQEKSLIKY